MPGDPAIELTKHATDSYGPYAFGLVAIVVIILLLVASFVTLYARVIKPFMAQFGELSKANAEAQVCLDRSLERVERIADTQNLTTENLKQLAQVLQHREA